MEIKVNFLDKLRLEARFDDFTVVADQPIRYKGDGSAPGPFDYFLASSAQCAAYFVKLYCVTRNIPTDNIRLSQNNIVDPENRYKQIFKIQVELPADISAKDRQGILRSIDRCTVKKVVQAGPECVIEEVENLDADAQALLLLNPASETSTYIAGKDLPLEQTIANMSGVLAGLGDGLVVGGDLGLDAGEGRQRDEQQHQEREQRDRDEQGEPSFAKASEGAAAVPLAARDDPCRMTNDQ